MKILITGHKGFIGNELTAALNRIRNQYDYELYGFDIEKNPLDDIRDRIRMDKFFETNQIDMVIHLAALPGVRKSEEFPDEYTKTNILGTKNVLDSAKKYGVKHFIFFSSSSVLGGNSDIGNSGLTENQSYNPLSFYAMTKVAGEMLVRASGLNYTIIRPFTVYGYNCRPDMLIGKWIKQIKAGRQITIIKPSFSARGFTHIDDLVGGMVRAIELAGMLTNETIHLGGAELITVEDIYRIFKDFLAGKKGIDFGDHSVDYKERTDGDPLYSFANINKAWNLLGWRPQHKFEYSLRDILKSEF
ncbi:MAG: NAD(P)-dependent oxidoreductase [Parcubacteria group bacterium]|jgi:UDP-glucuronate 4-epimerase